MNKPSFVRAAAAAALLSSLSFGAMAAEMPLGDAKEIAGMEIGSVYLQPITMDKVMGLPAARSDIHLELDIHALKNNPHFSEGWWIPYLTIDYTLEKMEKDKPTNTQKGELMAMVANDGPHYGSNIKLNGPGKYRATFVIKNPGKNKKEMFGRHIDKETGVPEWFDDVKVQWTFNYAGTGKKGGY